MPTVGNGTRQLRNYLFLAIVFHLFRHLVRSSCSNKKVSRRFFVFANCCSLKLCFFTALRIQQEKLSLAKRKVLTAVPCAQYGIIIIETDNHFHQREIAVSGMEKALYRSSAHLLCLYATIFLSFLQAVFYLSTLLCLGRCP